MDETYGLTLLDALRALQEAGYDGQFRPIKGGGVECTGCGRASAASEFQVDRTERIEGVSDPADETLVAALQCPHCEARGALILAFGPRARRADVEALEGLPRGPRRTETAGSTDVAQTA